MQTKHTQTHTHTHTKQNWALSLASVHAVGADGCGHKADGYGTKPTDAAQSITALSYF